MTGFSETTGLGALLRHLFELLDGDVEAVYASEGLDCRSRFTPVFRHIERHGPSSIRAIALNSGLSHSAVSQTISEMLKKELVAAVAGQDGRERIVSLTAKGEATLSRVQVVWGCIDAAAAELSSVSGHDLVRVLQDAIAAAQRTPFKDRIRDRLDKQAVDGAD